MYGGERFSAQCGALKIETVVVARSHGKLLLARQAALVGQALADAITDGSLPQIGDERAAAGESQFFSIRITRVSRVLLLLQQANDQLRHHVAIRTRSVGKASGANFKLS